MIRIINWQQKPASIGWVEKRKVNNILKEWESAAKEKLVETKADHVVYGYKKYFSDRNGEETFELNLTIASFNDEEFYKRTSSFGTDYLVYALHNGTNL